MLVVVGFGDSKASLRRSRGPLTCLPNRSSNGENLPVGEHEVGEPAVPVLAADSHHPPHHDLQCLVISFHQSISQGVVRSGPNTRPAHTLASWCLTEKLFPHQLESPGEFLPWRITVKVQGQWF